MNGKLWTEADELLLEERWGEWRVEKIAKALDRTVSSIHNRANMLRLGRRRPANVMSLNETMKEVLGLDSHSVVLRWIGSGILKAERGLVYGGARREWWIREPDLVELLRSRPWLFDRRKVQLPWRDELADQWITLVEAFRRGAAYPGHLEGAAKAGLIPEAVKRGDNGVWVVPERILPGLIAARRRISPDDAEHRRLIGMYSRNERRGRLQHRKKYLTRRANAATREGGRAA